MQDFVKFLYYAITYDIHTYVCIGLSDPSQDLQPVSPEQPADSTPPVVEDKNPLSSKDQCYAGNMHA